MKGLMRGCCLWLLLVSLSVSAEPVVIENFYGDYVGHAQMDNDDVRDLSVTIRPEGDSGQFSVRWTTVTHRDDGSIKRKVYRIKFNRTDRPNIFQSAMKTNVFGRQIPLDPIQGDPFVWARLKDRTLTLYALLITDEGDYEMQIYDRTLNEKGLLLDFRRKRSGEQYKRITTQLIRVAD